jgi:hypothetical protein
MSGLASLTPAASPLTIAIVFIAVGVLAISALVLAHFGLIYVYLLYARRFCRKHGLTLVRWRCGPAWDASGVKTEYTLFYLDCLDDRRQQRSVRLLIWIFGVHEVVSPGAPPEPKAPR